MPLTELLCHLVRVERDALSAYDQAIANLIDREAKEILVGFRGDHQRHLDSLTQVLIALERSIPSDGHPSALPLAGLTGLSAGMGAATGLAAMETNEVITNQAYDMALADPDLPPDLRDSLQQHQADERRHMEGIRDLLAERSPVSPFLDLAATLQGQAASWWINGQGR